MGVVERHETCCMLRRAYMGFTPVVEVFHGVRICARNPLLKLTQFFSEFSFALLTVEWSYLKRHKNSLLFLRTS